MQSPLRYIKRLYSRSCLPRVSHFCNFYFCAELATYQCVWHAELRLDVVARSCQEVHAMCKCGFVINLAKFRLQYGWAVFYSIAGAWRTFYIHMQDVVCSSWNCTCCWSEKHWLAQSPYFNLTMMLVCLNPPITKMSGTINSNVYISYIINKNQCLSMIEIKFFKALAWTCFHQEFSWLQAAHSIQRSRCIQSVIHNSRLQEKKNSWVV